VALAKKGRRPITVDGVQYQWWVAEWDESPQVDYLQTLAVASEDGRLFVRYTLGQPPALRHVVVEGPDFQGTSEPGPWRRFRCPAFGEPTMVTPKDVAALIRWCRTPSADAVAVDSRGEPIRPADET